MKFTKMHGLGNDYIYVDCFHETIEDPAGFARKMSDRHFGIGGDGVILVCPSEKADVRMDMYNADGSRGEMCGNGIRCVGKYAYDSGITDKTEIDVETLAGIKHLSMEVENGKVKTVTVNMGEPEFDPARIPVEIPRDFKLTEGKVIGLPLDAGDIYRKGTCVSMGNPHVVFFEEDIDHFPLEVAGPIYESHPAFPQRVNAEFAEVENSTHIRMRVYERGSGETLACGTGACAVLVASVLNGLAAPEADVQLRGGILHIRWDREENVVYMTGPAETVYEGEVEWPSAK